MYGTFSDYYALTHSMEQIPPSEVYIPKHWLSEPRFKKHIHYTSLSQPTVGICPPYPK